MGRFAGTYDSDNARTPDGQGRRVGLVTGRLTVFRPTGPDTFAPIGTPTALTFERNGRQVTRVIVRSGSRPRRTTIPAKPVAKPTAAPKEGDAQGAAALNWPQFRGPDATGVADGQHPPITWDVKAGTNVQWKTPIPGLGHSCPVVWGDRVFLTTAV